MNILINVSKIGSELTAMMDDSFSCEINDIFPVLKVFLSSKNSFMMFLTLLMEEYACSSSFFCPCGLFW